MLKVGDRVTYSSRWLKSVGICTGDLPFARGVIKSVKSLSHRCHIATIDWGNEDIPARVNVANLVKRPRS